MKAGRQPLHIVCPNCDRLGESPIWHPAERALYWVDFYGPTVRRWTPDMVAPQNFALPKGSTIGAIAFAGDGRLLVALEDGVHWFDKDLGTLQLLADPNDRREGVSYNDAKCDRQGRLWIGTYDVAERDPRGALYRIDCSGQGALADSGFVVSNGPAFSPDGATLYFSDTCGRQLLAYRVDPTTGRLSERRRFADLEHSGGMPDGICVDCEGGIWCAIYGGGRVLHLTPDGSVDQVIEVPVATVTSCCLGGNELRTLFMCSAEDSAMGGRETQSYNGRLMSVAVEVAGLPEPLFLNPPYAF